MVILIKSEVPNMCSRDSNENPFGYQNPQQQNMQYENLKITTNDKINLHGWFIKQADHLKRPTIIYFHENAGSKIFFKLNFVFFINILVLYHSQAFISYLKN